MQPRFLTLALAAACLISAACAPKQATLQNTGDQRVLDAYAAGKTEKPGWDPGLRWPNGNGFSETRKLVKIEKIDARSNAFGQRELKVRVTYEVSGWKVIDGKKQPNPEIRKETEERWIPA